MRMTVTRLLGTAMLLACCAATAQATQYPNPTFPDTLSIHELQHPLAVPHPINPDTVNGIQGIVTGFDPLPTGYAIYVQSPSGNGWTGIDVFTGGTGNTCEFAIGDLVAIYGKMQEFQGESEIEGLDAIQATRDLVIRKISSGNPLPPYHVGTVSELREVPFANPAGSDSVREKWEGMLVRVEGPLRVVRTSLTAGLGTFNSFLVVDNTVCPSGSPGPCDSMMVDGSTLTNVFPPTVGTLLTGVQGIYNQRTRGYRIQLTGADDLEGALPPNLVDAYSIDTDEYQVVFDRAITTGSAEDENNYSTGSLRTCLSAVQVSPTQVNLTFEALGAPPHGGSESITASGLTSQASSTTMTDPQSRTFTNGVLTLADIQSPHPDSLALAICKDVSKYIGSNNGIGTRVSFRGVVTAMLGSAGNMQDAASGLRSGMQVFAPQCNLIVGHQYFVAAQLTEFGTGTGNLRETETQGTAFIVDEGPVAQIAATVVPIATLASQACDASQSVVNGEDYEGVLVRVNYGRVIRNANAGQNFTIQAVGGGAADTVLIDNAAGVGTYTYDPNLNDVVSVTGVVRHSGPAGSAFQYRILPRNNADILFHGNNVNVGPGPQAISFAVAPNPARTPRLDFSLPHKAPVELAVFDLQGRKLRVLANGSMDAGSYSRTWDGLDASGAQAGAGVYFYRLKVGTEVRTIRGTRVE